MNVDAPTAEGCQPTALRILAVFQVLLMLATWPLWWGGSSFPAIPWLVSGTPPGFVDRVSVCLLLASCVLIARSRPQRLTPECGGRPAAIEGRRGVYRSVFRNFMKCCPFSGNRPAMVALVCGVQLALTNQHRLQPWHWLFVLSLVSHLVLRSHQFVPLLRHILASVYVAAALSRICDQPELEMSGQILRQLCNLLGLTGALQSAETLRSLCHFSTIVEFLTGAGLMWGRTRGMAVLSACGLHGLLLLALGPIGLRHQPGVLLWNVCFLFLIPTVYCFPGKAFAAVPGVPAGIAFRAGTGLAWLLPLSGLVGLMDNWPSWQLYSPRPETLTLEIHNDDIRLLPESLTRFLQPNSPFSHWQTVSLDRWSLEATGSPLYPQRRFLLALSQEVARRSRGTARFRITESRPGFPRWWQRTEETSEFP